MNSVTIGVKWWLRAMVAIAAMATAVGCGSGGASAKKVIQLGAVIDKTGSAGPASWAGAAKLAADQMNEALSATGSNIEFNLNVSDSTNVASVALARGTDLVKSQGVKGLVVDTSQDFLALAELQYDSDSTKHLNVPIVGMVNTSSIFNNPNASVPTDPLAQAAYRDADRWFFRTTMSSAPHGQVLAQILLGKGPAPAKVSMFASDEPFGLGQIGSFSAALTALVAPKSVAMEKVLFSPPGHPPTDVGFFATEYGLLTDKHNETAGADDGAPDYLLGFTFPDYLAAIIKAHKQANGTIPFLHGMALRNQKILDSLGSVANGMEGVCAVVVDNNDSGKTFARDIKAATGLAANSYDSETYDAAAVLMLASLIAAHGQSDPTAISGAQVRDAMSKTSDPAGQVVRPGVDGFKQAVSLINGGKAVNYEGASGPCDFDDHGNVRSRLVHFIIENGAFIDKEIYDCVASAATCPKL